MNLFFLVFINTFLHLARTCPIGNRKQVVKPSRQKEAVVCKFYGGKVPLPDRHKR